MANRSYLYATDTIPTKGQPNPSYGLAEYNWDIPVVFKLMMANEPRRTASAIWNHDIGIIADRRGAVDRVEAFAALLIDGHPHADELKAQLEEMREVLRKTPPTKYLLLEVGEIVDLMDGELATNVEEVISGIADVVKLAADPKTVAKWRKRKLDEMNLGYWSDVLYFDLPKPSAAASSSPETEASPAAKAAATKPTRKAAATKPAATKPAAKATVARPATRATAARPAGKSTAARPTRKATATKPAGKAAAAKRVPKKSAAKKSRRAR